MATKSVEQRIQELSERMKKLDAQKQLLEAGKKDKDRKERTRRLIQIGAIMDNIGIDTIEKAELLKANITNNPKAKEWFEKLFTENKEIEESKLI